jgi:DNA-binding NarL/FixJ family response regulator
MGQAESAGIISVYLVAEQKLFRQMLVRRFEKRADLRVVGDGCLSESTAEKIFASQCDLLLLDSLETSSDADVCSAIQKNSLPIKVLFFGMENCPNDFLAAVRSGANGYILKDASAGELIAAIRDVAQGNAVCPSNLCTTLFKVVANEERAKKNGNRHMVPGKSQLTLRQRQLVGLVAKGLTNKEIAANLNISEFTVKNHLRRLMRQVDAGSRLEAVDVIRANGMISTVA